MSSSSFSPTGYILHHLRHWTSIDFPGNVPVLSFSYINWDTIFWSVLMGILSSGFMVYLVSRCSSGTPSRMQASLEILVDLVNTQVRALVPYPDSFIASVALTVLTWVALMNSLDFLPVDLFPWIGETLFGIHYMRIVPTADINGALGVALGVLVLTLYYSVRYKGFSGLLYEMLSSPFGANPIMWVPNLFLNIVEYFSKTISLAMRLFGNMYSGELLFLLIALLGSTITVSGAVAQVILGTAWAIFHIFVVFLQAFIFMMLTLIYIGQGQKHH